MPRKYPILRGILNRRMMELQLMMCGISAGEVYNLSDWDLERDVKLVSYIMEKRGEKDA